jgi:predicted permease
MENLVYSISTVLPLLLIGVLGFFLRRIGMLSDDFLDGVGKLIYYISFPIATFKCLAACSLRDDFALLPVLLIVAYNVCFGGMAVTVVPKLVRDRPTAASLCQCLVRQARLAQSIPLLTIMYGESGIAASMLVMPIAVIMENLTSVSIFLFLTPNNSRNDSRLKSTLRSFITNPIIIAAILGIAFSFFGWNMPQALSPAVSGISSTASPLALIMMGAQFEPNRFKRSLRLTLPTSLIHLLVFPAIMSVVSVVLGLRGNNLSTILLYTGSANAASSVVLAKNMGGNEDIASQCLCLTMALSGLTLMLGIFILKMLYLI